MNVDPKAKAAAVLNYYDIEMVKTLLAPVPFGHAQPIYQMLLDLTTHQILSGLQHLVQTTVDAHEQRQAMQALSTPNDDVN